MRFAQSRSRVAASTCHAIITGSASHPHLPRAPQCPAMPSPGLGSWPGHPTRRRGCRTPDPSARTTPPVPSTATVGAWHPARVRSQASRPGGSGHWSPARRRDAPCARGRRGGVAFLEAIHHQDHRLEAVHPEACRARGLHGRSPRAGDHRQSRLRPPAATTRQEGGGHACRRTAVSARCVVGTAPSPAPAVCASSARSSGVSSRCPPAKVWVETA